MIVIFLLIILLCFNIFMSLFCLYMKQKDKRKIMYSRGMQKSNSESTNIIKKKRILSTISVIAQDMVFCYFKCIGYIPSHHIRLFFYKHIFRMDLGKNVVIYSAFETRNPWNIRIGSGSIVGDRVIMDARYGIELGENVNISTGAWFWTLQHDVNAVDFTSQGTGGAITIKDRAWISSRTTILPGCVVQEGCVIAAGAVVTKSCEDPFSIYGGIPAKKIGKRNNEINYIFDGKHRHFI